MTDDDSKRSDTEPLAHSAALSSHTDREGASTDPGEFPDERTDPAQHPFSGRPADTEFDAVAAAAELDAVMATETAADMTEPHTTSYLAMLEQELESVNGLLEQRDAELAQARAEIDQARAEIDQIVSRVEREADKRLEQRRRKLLLGFLDVLDDLDRAIAAVRDGGHVEAVIEGVELVRRRFLAKLAEFGVTHRPAMGARFDPALHEAMAAVPVTDAAQDGVVVGVVREGYAIGDETLRPAGVAVGKRAG